MGSYKQAQLEEESRQQIRMSQNDWPKCDRCSEPVEYESVILDDNGDIDWFQTNSLCSYCEHMSNKDN